VVTLTAFLRFVLPRFVPEAIIIGVLGGVVCGLLVALWWAFFSRAPRTERWGAILLMVAAMAVTSRLVDKSIATGMMGMMFFIVAIPLLSFAFVAWAVATRNVTGGMRWATMAATVILAGAG